MRRKLLYIYVAIAVTLIVLWYQHPVAMGLLAITVAYFTIRDMFRKRARSGPVPRRNPKDRRVRRD